MSHPWPNPNTETSKTYRLTPIGEELRTFKRLVKLGDSWFDPRHIVSISPTDGDKLAVHLSTGKTVWINRSAREQVESLARDLNAGKWQ